MGPQRVSLPTKHIGHVGTVVVMGLGLFLPITLNPWGKDPFEQPKALLLWVAGLLILSLLLQNQAEWRLRIQDVSARPLIIALLMFGGLLSVSSALALDPWLALTGPLGLLTHISGLCLALFLIGTVHRGDVDMILIAGTVGTLPVILYGFLQLAGLDPFVWDSNAISPILSTLGRSNYVAAYLAVQIPLLIGLLPHHPALRWQLGVTLGLAILCLLLTRARAGWLAATAGAAVVILAPVLAERGWGQLLYKGVALLVVSLMLYIGFDQMSRPEMVVIGEDNGLIPYGEIRAESVDRRLLIWRETLPLVLEAGWFGFGPASFTASFEARVPTGSLFVGRDSLVTDPHNYILKTFVETGYLGGLSLLTILILFAHQMGKSVWSRDLPPSPSSFSTAWGIAGGLLAWFVQAQFNPDTVVLTYLFWLLLGLWGGRQMDHSLTAGAVDL